MTLVFSLDYESVGSDDWRDAKAPATVELELAAALLTGRCDPARVLVGGRPEQAILAYARATGHDFVALLDGSRSLSRRGRGGSVTQVSLVALVASGTTP